MARWEVTQSKALLEKFLSRKTIEPETLVKLPFAICHMLLWHLETLSLYRVEQAEAAYRAVTGHELILYACGSCGNLTRGQMNGEPVHCPMPGCEGRAYPLPQKEGK